MNKEGFSIKTIVAIGIGSALFLIIGMFVNIPTPIPNTTIQLTYAFLAMIAAIFGPVAGLLTGLIGHTLKDMMTYGAWWSWIIGSGVVGLITGFAQSKININEGVFERKQIIAFNLYQILANFAAWFVVAPFLDILIYAEPVRKSFAQGIVAGLTNMISVAIFGTLLLYLYSKTITQQGSLDKE